MTTTLERSDRPAVSGRTATLALARAEGRRLVRSPFWWCGALLAVALGVAWSWTRMPTWDTFAQNAGMSSLVLAAALLVATHRATSRDRRAGAEESTRTMPAGRARRGLAMLAAVPIAAATGAAVVLAELLLLLPAWPVGRLDPWALAVVVVVPPTGAVLGILVGRVLPGVAAGPLTLVALTVLFIATLALPSGRFSVAEALWPVPNQPWEIGAARPTGWHLLYLLGALVAVVAANCWRAWPRASVAVLVPALAVAGLSVHQQARQMPSIIDMSSHEALTGPAVLRCETHEQVRFCALPRYEGWIGRWREAVEPVAAHLPASAARPAVRQIGSADDLRPMSPGLPEVITTDSWGRTGGWAEDSRARLMRDYAAAAVGVLRRGVPLYNGCDGAGQHRTVAGLWLLAQAAPDGVQRVRDGELRLPRVRYGPAETQAAAALLDRPYDEVAGYLAVHWADILEPSATGLAGLGVTLTPAPASDTAASAEPLDDGGVCR
jgi:hypothetical protein